MSISEDNHQPGARWARAARRYGPFAAAAGLLVTAVVVFRDSGDDAPDDDHPVATDPNELILTGPMTPARAELEGENVDFGPNCDEETGRIMVPTVYAPPCVPPFEGDNGGVTSTGVTGDSIDLVLYVPRDDFFFAMLGVDDELDPGVVGELAQDYVDLYGSVFETYGRGVNVEVVHGRGAADDDAQAQADAIAIAEKEPFAVIGGPYVANAAFADELAARGVVCLPGCAGSGLTDSFVADRSPHIWPDGMTPQQSGLIAGEVIGALAGPDEPAVLAGDPELTNEERVYGVLYPEQGGAEMFPALEAGLATYGIEVAVGIEYSLDASQVQEEMRSIVVRLVDDDVTTVIVTGAPFTPGFVTNEATEQGYFPEWILGPNFFADTRLFTERTDQENQWMNGFGIGYKLTAGTGGSAGEAAGVYEWAYGTEPEDVASMPYLEPSIRTLFTGIHLAGEDLTPATFRDGLFRFPPSGDGVTSAVVSWGDHGTWPELDHAPEDDVTIIWWDPEATDHPDRDWLPADARGFYRLADGGQRYRLGELPDSLGLHDDDSSVLMYSMELPPEIEELSERYSPPDLPE